jgi:hypothetical protein
VYYYYISEHWSIPHSCYVDSHNACGQFNMHQEIVNITQLFCANVVKCLEIICTCFSRASGRAVWVRILIKAWMFVLVFLRYVVLCRYSPL